jgi:hypothetical protein
MITMLEAKIALILMTLRIEKIVITVLRCDPANIVYIVITVIEDLQLLIAMKYSILKKVMNV